MKIYFFTTASKIKPNLFNNNRPKKLSANIPKLLFNIDKSKPGLIIFLMTTSE